MLASVVSATSFPLQAPAADDSQKPKVSSYRGLGSWVDIYDTYEWDHPGETIKTMKKRGVRTLYLETGNYHSHGAIFRPAATERFIHHAHRRGMRVVAWYLPGFKDLRKDKRRVKAAIDYRTSRGQRFDSFALDIEADIVHPVSVRIERMLRLSRWIRRSAGPSYPLGAIVLSPYGMKRVPDYWGPLRKFPFAELERIYDVFVPMSYFTYRVETPRDVVRYNSFNVRYIRRKSGNPEVPIHPIGGISSDANRKQTRAYVRTVRQFGLLGGSYYAFDGTRWEHWRELRNIPVNPRQSPALPVPLGTGYGPPIGNVPVHDRSHPKEVYFRFGRRSSAQFVSFEAFDAQFGEVELQVNWRPVGDVPRGPDGDWSGPQSLKIPRWALHDDRKNVISFVADGNFPDWSRWGIRKVAVRDSAAGA